ncbi:MAG: SulP family inorganic anion transporter [Bacteroidota bacterium]
MDSNKNSSNGNTVKGKESIQSSDIISGLIVSLLALPLSLGIAKASDFPPLMGLISAIIGGMVVSFFAGSKLTIKGPAAGLIVIAASAVADFGGGEKGWHLAMGTIIVAGVIQILFGVFKLGKWANFFPLSAIHGMLAAIGLIIIAKQIPVLLNVDPLFTKGKDPLELLASIPEFIFNMNPKVAVIGVISLIILFVWQTLKNPILRKIPAPLIILAFSIPAGIFLDFKNTAPTYTLVHIGNFIDSLQMNADFSGLSQTGIFIKYVIMFALVGTLESLLTVKAIDILDPAKQKSNTNKDLIAIGIGNIISGILGGLPMISEVARSSNNLYNGGKTRWANFFHGFFILIFLLLAVPLLEMIPNTALAAMLITVGFKLAHPMEFVHIFKIGKEQLAIFLVTIFFTLFEDLLVGIAAGIVLKLIIHLFNGAKFKSLFKATIRVVDEEFGPRLIIEQCAIFSNWLGLKKILDELPQKEVISIDFSELSLVDHSVLENLHDFKNDYESSGGKVEFQGLDQLNQISNHPLAARRLKS